MEYPQGFFDTYHSQKPICGVLAVAIAAGVTYDVAHAACKRNMAAHRQRFGGKTGDGQRVKAMAELGVKTEYVELKGSLKDVIEQLEPGIIYHIIYARHVISVKDGNIIDQSFNGHYLTFSKVGSRRVKKVLKIIGRGW